MTTWQDVEKHWAEFKPKIKARWSKLTDTDLDKIKGKRDELVSQIESRYKSTKGDVEAQIDEFLEQQRPIVAGKKR